MDTPLKRLALLELLDGGIVLPLADGAAADRIGEREALLGVYPVDDTTGVGPPPPVVVSFSASLIAQSALVTAILSLVPRVTVKPVPLSHTTEVSWGELVRQAEGADYANRNRFVAYTFGNGRRTRQFWGG